MSRSPGARRTGIAISTALTVVFGWFAAVAGIASLGPDGTWTDTVSFLAFTALTLMFAALAVGGTR